MKILILNSDSPNNRGDRAILSGNIELLRSKWPDSSITSLSEFPERDSEWFGIDFLPFSPYTMNPLNLFRICIEARKCDVVFWGGGEILKDYTNKLGLVYWYFRILSIRIVNKNIVGLFQGIGPTNSKFGKKLICNTVNLTEKFITRDEKSKNKLVEWGVKVPIVSSYDPAVLLKASNNIEGTLNIIKTDYDLDKEFFENCIGIGVRRWFHYQKGGFIPNKFKFWSKPTNTDNTIKYVSNLVSIIDYLMDKYDYNVALFPMHNSNSEGDDVFSENIKSRVKSPKKVLVLSKDNLSPQDIVDASSVMKVFIASRLHSSIIATSALVPSMVFYYVDKGKLYFEQIKMKDYSYPIESLLDSANLEKIKHTADNLIDNENTVKSSLKTNVDKLRKEIKSNFMKALN